MKCQKCKRDLQENLLQLSHDVPCYLFQGRDRKEKKKQADKFGRRYLCQKCHDIYEKMVFSEAVESFIIDPKLQKIMIERAQEFSKRWFKDGFLH